MQFVIEIVEETLLFLLIDKIRGKNAMACEQICLKSCSSYPIQLLPLKDTGPLDTSWNRT